MSNPSKVESHFTFEISLTVLNHLGRSLYRNFITIIGEAISNSWDAGAKNVWIELRHDTNTMLIVDDGVGMTADQLQNRFLKIGYSKRSDPSAQRAHTNRPLIGAKGIGKLALLSCASRVSVATKADGSGTSGCLIDNSVLDDAIRRDSTPEEVHLADSSSAAMSELAKLSSGTCLFFDELYVANSSDDFLRKALAMSFKFALIDSDFHIHYNGEEVTPADLQGLAANTEYLWTTTGFKDPYLQLLGAKEPTEISLGQDARGFVASVKKPSQLAIYGAEERVGIDLFVNGRLRQQHIERYFPSARVAGQYLYGQIHLDALDDGGTTDNFTSSREGVVAGNRVFEGLIQEARTAQLQIIDDWDKYRLRDNEEGDAENTRRSSKRDRAVQTLVREAIQALQPDERKEGPLTPLAARLQKEASVAVTDYIQIYVIENALRSLLEAAQVELTAKEKKEANRWKGQQQQKLREAKISSTLQARTEPIWYLNLPSLIDIADRQLAPDSPARMSVEKAQLVVLRNSVMHTSGLTAEGKTRLSVIRDEASVKLEKLLEELGRRGPK